MEQTKSIIFFHRKKIYLKVNIRLKFFFNINIIIFLVKLVKYGREEPQTQNTCRESALTKNSTFKITMCDTL